MGAVGRSHQAAVGSKLRLPDSWDGVHITVKELPIVLSVAVWGNKWEGLSAAITPQWSPL